MEKTALADWETCRSTFNFSLEIRINFFKDDKKVFRFKTMKLRHSNQHFKFRFLVSVFPYGVDKETEGWLVVVPDVRVPKHEPRPRDYGILSCTVSVIDIEGNSVMPRSFVEIPAEEGDSFPKYFERSAILNRKDEFLSGNILTLRCDIHFYLNTVFREGLIHRILKNFLRPIPQEFFYKNESQTEDSHDTSKSYLRHASKTDLSDTYMRDLSDISKRDLSDTSKTNPNDISKRDLCDASKRDLSDTSKTNPNGISKRDSNGISKKDLSDAFTVFDFTHQILTLPPSHEARKRFGLHADSVSLSSFSSEPNGDITDILEHVWMFDTENVRFLLSIDERLDNVGTRLLKSSPVIRGMVNTPMKERLEKRIPFLDTTSRAFIIVLYFLEKETLPTSENRDFLDVYKFAHFHEMGVLQRKCAEAMVKCLVYPTEELKRTAENYSDKHFLKLLESRRLDYDGLEQPRLKMNGRPDSDCYI